MSTVVIHGEGLGKSYRRGALQQSMLLRDHLSRALKSPLSVFRRSKGETFWALKDVSLEVREGEVVGIIGRNGAGKTTLLKILSRITRPTTGCAEIHGRVGSLLEVGTGFHPELTGRDNIFLNGAILGMRRAEIARKFDEIVAFAEVEKFIDTPVKRYSSGMYMRLAFAVAAHLQTEILLVDEVLSVGDIEFQKKCMGKMGEVARRGKTIIFVSHNLNAVNVLCPRSILIERGKIATDGSTPEVLSVYYSRNAPEGSGLDLTNKPRTAGTGAAVFTSIVMQPLGKMGDRLPVLRPGDDLQVDIEIETRTDALDSCVDFFVCDAGGYRLVDISSARRGEDLKLRSGEKIALQFVLRSLLLKPGIYTVGLHLGRHRVVAIDYIERAATFQVAPDAATSQSVIDWPGPYVCRFDSTVSYSISNKGDRIPCAVPDRLQSPSNSAI
jgi:lipopolysaccharide transport system ATP-binding protein